MMGEFNTAEEMLCVGTVDNIADLINECDFSLSEQAIKGFPVFFLGEAFPQEIIRPKQQQDLLLFTHFNTAINFAIYTSGCIFHAGFELRWQKQDGQTRVTYLGNKRTLSQHMEPQQQFIPNDYDTRTTSYHLFGTLLVPERLEMMGLPNDEKNMFAELRIPRLLHYPAPQGAERVQLTVLEYLKKETGAVELFRFLSLKKAEKESEVKA